MANGDNPVVDDELTELKHRLYQVEHALQEIQRELLDRSASNERES